MKVTVLLVNYNNWQDTIECLESVLKSIHLEIEIMVVDNSPDTTSLINLEDWAKGTNTIQNTLFPNLVFPEIPKPLNFISISEKAYFETEIFDDKDIVFIKAAKNNGFAAANNIVLRKIVAAKAPTDFVFLLNNDTVLPPDTITNLIAAYKGTSIGIAGCTLLEYHDALSVQSVGGVYNRFFGITRQVLEGMQLDEFKNQENKAKIDYPVGAAMFLSTTVLKDIGLLDEEFFLYFEELDWVERGKKKYTTTYFEDCFVFHKGGVSIGSGTKSYISDKYSILNRINFAKKHNRSNLISIYFGVFLAIFKRLLFFKLSRGVQLMKDILKNES